MIHSIKFKHTKIHVQITFDLYDTFQIVADLNICKCDDLFEISDVNMFSCTNINNTHDILDDITFDDYEHINEMLNRNKETINSLFK